MSQEVPENVAREAAETELPFIAIYGDEERWQNVTDLVRQNFWRTDHCLHIPLECNFNRFFGDPHVGWFKHLTITINGRTPLAIPENPNRSYCLRLIPEEPPRCTTEELERVCAIPMTIISLVDSRRRSVIARFLQETRFSVTVFDAVDGRQLLVGPNSITYPPRNLTVGYEPWPGGRYWRLLTKGELGACLSHYCLYRQIVEQTLPWMVILEDDFIFKESENRIVEVLAALPDPTTFDICFFQGTDHLSQRTHGLVDLGAVNSHYYRTRVNDGVFAYLVTQRGAQALVRDFVLRNTADGVIADVFNGPERVVLASYNKFAVHPGYPRGSDIWSFVNEQK